VASWVFQGGRIKKNESDNPTALLFMVYGMSLWINGIAMHKVILMILLAVVSSGSRAEWVEIGETEEKDLTVYADPTTIRKTGNTVKMWSLDDYKSVRNTLGLMNLSSRSLNEYDCKEKQVTMHFLYVHSGNMGRGEAVQINGEYCCWWSHVSPESMGEILWKFACGK